jgi:hypothetical protein
MTTARGRRGFRAAGTRWRSALPCEEAGFHSAGFKLRKERLPSPACLNERGPVFPRRTVFVLGAGASCDLGLPAGDEFRNTLLEVLSRDTNDRQFNNEYLQWPLIARSQQKGTDWPPILQEYVNAAARIRFGLPLAVSIDNYLDAHRNDSIMQEIGKIAISIAVLRAEQNSVLYTADVPPIANIDRLPSNPKLEGSWYLPFMRLLTSGKSVEEVNAIFDNIAFVVFNYDRCLEHFLVNAIMTYFNLSPQTAIESVQRLAIVHPYGRVGYLPWQEQAITADFGNPKSDLNMIAKGIQTFTESTDSGAASRVKEVVAQAETLVLMGYGYLHQNNELLHVEESSVRRVFSTTWGISDQDIPVVKQEISKIIAKRESSSDDQQRHPHYAEIFIERGDCRDLMTNHRFRLSRGPEPLLFLRG